MTMNRSNLEPVTAAARREFLQRSFVALLRKAADSLEGGNLQAAIDTVQIVHDNLGRKLGPSVPPLPEAAHQHKEGIRP